MSKKDEEMKLLADFLESRRPFGSMIRFRVTDYDEERELKLVEEIGKARSPHFVIDQENRFAYLNFIRWCNCSSDMEAIDPKTGKVKPGELKRGIYLAGNTGSGKSWCLEIMRVYAQWRGFRIEFPKNRWEQVMINRPLAWKNERADDVCRCFTTEGGVSEYSTRNILGIQDLGQEPPEALYMGNRSRVMQELLEYRGDIEDQLTLITSNLKLEGEALRERYGERVQSRLYEMCNYLILRGVDRRKGV